MPRAERAEHQAKTQARQVAPRLSGRIPKPCALTHANPYQFLVATILSAQCTDARVNMVTPELFRRFPDPASLAAAGPGELEALIRSTGFFRAKTRSLLAMAGQVVERHDGEIPRDLDAPDRARQGSAARRRMSSWGRPSESPLESWSIPTSSGWRRLGLTSTAYARADRA